MLLLATHEIELLTFFEQIYWEKGHYPNFITVKDFIARYLPSDTYPDNWDVSVTVRSDTFKTALQSRGLPTELPSNFGTNKSGLNLTDILGPAVGDTPNRRLKPEQVLALNLVCNLHDRRSITAKLKTIGVTTQQWQAWLRNKAFEEIYRKEIARRFGSVDIDAQQAIARNVQEGDLASIKYFHELTGIYNPNVELTMNLGSILASMMEILAKYVAPDALVRIADELEGVVNPNRPPANILDVVGAEVLNDSSN